MGNEISVRFVISDFECDPEDISKLLSITPTVTWRVGESIAGTIRRHKENGWRLDSPMNRSQEIDEQIKGLLSQLEPKAELLRHLAEDFYSEFSCIIYAYDYVPSINLSNETLSRMADLGAAIDIDLYCLIE